MSAINPPPLVSIIIPTYNRAHLISETIQTVLNQTYANWELIIIDDGSEDNTLEMVSRFSCDRIRYVLIEHCGIFGKVRNEGLKISRGEYVAFLDSDDLWSSDKLEIQLTALNKFPEALFVFNNVTIFGMRSYASPRDYDALFVGSLLLFMLEESRFVFYPSALLFKKEPIVSRLGFMDETLSFGTDTKYFLNMCQFFKGIFMNDRLVHIRKHEQSTTENYYTSAVFRDSIAIATSIYEDKAITRTQYHRILGRYYYKMGIAELMVLKKPKAAMISFSSCLRVWPFRWKAYVRLLQSFVSSARKRDENVTLENMHETVHKK